MSDDPLVSVSAAAILLAEQGLLRAAYRASWNAPYQRSYDAYVAATGRLVPPLPDAEAVEAHTSQARSAAYMAAARESQPFVAVALRAAADAIPADTGEGVSTEAKATAETLAQYFERMTDVVHAEVEVEASRPRGLRRLLPTSARVRAADSLARQGRARASEALEDLAEVAYRCADRHIALDVLEVLALALEDASRRWRDSSEADRIAAMAQAFSDDRDSALRFIRTATEQSGA